MCCSESCLLISNNSLNGTQKNISGLIVLFTRPLVHLQRGKLREVKSCLEKHRNAQIATIYLFVRQNAHSGCQTMIEPSSIFAFCMIDHLPPKFVSESQGSWLRFKVATYLCSSKCILCECKTCLIGIEAIHNTLIIM